MAPPVTEQELESWDAEKQEALAKAAMPEMGALWYISQSPQHQELVKHPVIKVPFFLSEQCNATTALHIDRYTKCF